MKRSVTRHAASVLLMLTCLGVVSVTPGCGVIALTAFVMYVIDYPDGPPNPNFSNLHRDRMPIFDI